MSKISAVILPFVCSSLLAAGVIFVTWPSPQALAQEKTVADQTVQAFMALGTSSKRSSETAKPAPDTPTTECIPCGQKGTEPVAGRVPSRPPPHPTDGDYERITGRAPEFSLPSESGKAPCAAERPRRGWAMMIVGPPVRQTNCFVEVEAGQLRVSRASGGLRLEPKVYSLSDVTTDPDAGLLVISVQAFMQLGDHRSTEWARDLRLDGWAIVSASPQNIYATPSSVQWTPARQRDVRIHLSPTGRITQMEYVQAQTQPSPLTAARVVWFPEYGQP